MSRSRARLLRAGLTAGALGAALLAAPEAAFAAPTNLMPNFVSPGGTTTISDPQATFNTTVGTVQLSTTACQSKLPAVGTSAAGPWNPTVGTRSGTSITFTVPSVNGPTAGANGAVRPYFACVYDGNVATSSNLQANSVLYVGSPSSLNVNSGVTGGGNQLTVNTGPNPVFAGVGPVAAVFSASPCNASLGANNPPNLVAANAVRLSNNSAGLTVPPGVVTSGPAPSTYHVCVFDGSTVNGPLLAVAMYSVTTVGVSPASGSYLASTGVTATSPLPFLSGVTTPAVLLLGMGAGCPSLYSTAPIGTVTPMPITGTGSVRRLSNNRAAVTIPPLQLSGGQPTTYQLCFYANNTATGSLVGSSNYTAAIVANPTGVVPAAGPSAGGNMITVVGTDFPTDSGRITATLGGAALTNIQSVSDKAFTATAPQHALGDGVTLVVTTPAGTKALPGAYSYLNPIKISPDTAPSTAPFVDVDVQGSGFMAINFGSSGNAGRVFLVRGTYDGADAGSGVRANPPLAECVNVLPIADEELVCTLQLNRRLNTNTVGFFDSITYTNTLTTDVSTTAGSSVITSTAGKFNANDVGQPIVQSGYANIPQYSLVTSVLSPTKAVISVPATATSVSAFTATIGSSTPAHTFTGALTTTNGSPTVTTSSGAFTRADVGRVITAGANIPSGTTVVSVAPGGTTATLSNPAGVSTQYTLANPATTTDGSTTLTSTSLTSADAGAVIGPNTLGIPVGTTLSTATSGSAVLSAAAVGNNSGSLTLNKPVNASLYAAAPVPDGSYNLVVVSNGAANAANTDPDYYQTDVTSSSTFTVAAF